METPSPFPISKTKITPPIRKADIITRPRLIEALHNLLNKKLTLISAPAGYGKTSLLIDLVDKSEIPVCWLSLDILDQEPQRFLSYFIACIRERFKSFGTESITILNNAASIDKENERLAISLTNEIYQNIHEHFAIVLDDYQFVDPIPEIHSFINRFVQLAGEHCHLILATRTLPSLADLHLLVARDQVGGLSLEDLAFLPEEIQTLFAQNSGQNLSINEAEELALKTDGWITSISLTGLSFAQGQIQQRTPITRTGIDLFDYFSCEVLEKQAPHIREFLLLTSLFDEVDIKLCHVVLEPIIKNKQQNWKTIFNFIQKNNLFVIPLGTDGLAFRYHHIFQDYLQAKLQEENPSIILEVMNRLASYYGEQHEWEKAHHIYESNNNLVALVKLIEDAGTYFIRNGRIATLGHWLDRLPLFSIEHSPKLLSLQGIVAQIKGETQLGISLLSRAEKGLRADHDDENLATTLIRRAVSYRDAGDYIHALADADEAISLTQGKENSNLQYNQAAAMRVKGTVLSHCGQTTDALKCLENSLSLFSLLEDSDYIPIVEMELGVIHHALGNNDIAIKFYLSASKTWEATGSLGWQAALLNNLGVLYHYRGDFEKAFQTLESAIDFARKSGYVRTQALALSSLGDLLIDLQEIKQAQGCFEQTMSFASQGGYSFLMFYASVARMRVARLENQFALAESISQDLLVKIKQNVTRGEEAIFRMEHGCLLLSLNKPNLASEEFARTVSLHELDGRMLDANISKLWLAASLIVSTQTASAILRLKEFTSATTEMKESALLFIAASRVQIFFDGIDLPPDITDSMQRIFNRSEQFTKSIPSIRRKLRHISKSAFISPPHLVIRAFGPAQVSLSGKKISISDWQTRETRDLFFFFLQSGTQTKEELAEVFWPDISPVRLKMRFKTNMYRLRHAIGQNTILFEGDQYFFNHDIDYEYDVENFNKFLGQANAATNIGDSKVFLQAAIDLVTGPYLADVDSDWAALKRTRIELQYHAALIRLAGLYLDDNQAVEALEVCQSALKNDPLMEEAYRLSMRAHAVLGDGASVARIFQTCIKTLDNELGVKPSRETEKLYQKLI